MGRPDYDKEYYQKNKDKLKQKRMERYLANREEELSKMKEYRDKEENKKRQKENVKKWIDNNRTIYNRKKREYENKRIANDPSVHMIKRLRWGLWNAVGRKGRNNRIYHYLGCDNETLIKHLESLFLPGMSWDNRNEWHIDHIIPISSFDHTDEEQVKACWHYSNLRPLWAEDNLKKGAKNFFAQGLTGQKPML